MISIVAAHAYVCDARGKSSACTVLEFSQMRDTSDEVSYRIDIWKEEGGLGE